MTESNRRASKSNQKKRVPVSGNHDILTVQGKDPNYVYRWVLDIDNRVQKFIDGGYEHVEHDVEVGSSSVHNSNVDGSVIQKSTGGARTSHLMRIKREWYEEDQAAKSKEVDKSEEVMKRKLNSREDGQYGKVSLGR